MGLFKSKEEKEQLSEEKINKLLEKHGLQNFPEEYRNTLRFTMMQENAIDVVQFSPGKNEKAYLELCTSRLSIIQEQNWMIIKLLHDIAQK